MALSTTLLNYVAVSGRMDKEVSKRVWVLLHNIWLYHEVPEKTSSHQRLECPTGQFCYVIRISRSRSTMTDNISLFCLLLPTVLPLAMRPFITRRAYWQ